MPHIECSERIDDSFYTAAPAAWQLALDLAHCRAPYQAPALAVHLGGFGLPDVGTVQVLVEVSVGNAVGIPPSEFAFTVAGKGSSHLFPRFDGRIRVVEDGEAHARIFLAGEYTAPLGTVGRLADTTVMRGVAEESLQAFLRWFVQETQARVRRGDYRTAAELMRDADG